MKFACRAEYIISLFDMSIENQISNIVDDVGEIRFLFHKA